jgi:hypothetical protein
MKKFKKLGKKGPKVNIKLMQEMKKSIERSLSGSA